MFTDHDQLLVLIESFYGFGHQSVFRLPVVFCILYGHRNSYRIADEYGAEEAEPFIPIGHGGFVDHIGCEPDGNAEDERTMGNPFFKGLRLTPFFVHVMREKVSGLTGMKDNIRLRDRAAGSLPALVDGKVFKM
jgi:hypothetical protein